MRIDSNIYPVSEWRNMKTIVTKISDAIYDLGESSDAEKGIKKPTVNAYLLIGKNGALLIDTLMQNNDLYETVRSLTDLPVTVLITHGHIDHVGVSTSSFAKHGCPIYMDLQDYPLIENRVPNLNRDFFTQLHDGSLFNIGGFELEAVACPGHTPGSFLFLDRMHQLIFSGDTLGSGCIWMQLDCSIPLTAYRENVASVMKRTMELKNLRIYPGHRYQSPVQLTSRYIKDIYLSVDSIIQGNNVGHEETIPWMGTTMTFMVANPVGQMLSFCYDKTKIS